MELPDIKFHSSVTTLPDFADNPVFYDIESGGLYINPRLFQFYCPAVNPDIHIVDIAPMKYDELDYMIELARVTKYVKEIWTIAYNSSYDHGTLGISPDKTDDLFYLVKSSYPEFQRFGLAEVTSKLPYTRGLYDGLDKKALQKAGFAPGTYLSQDQIKYAAVDVLALALMWDDKKIQATRKHNKSYEIDMISQRLALIYQNNPHIVDIPLRNKMLEKYLVETAELEAKLPTGLNVNSYKQVREYLDTTESDKTALAEYSLSTRPLAKQAGYIQALKKAKKRVSYLDKIRSADMVTKFNAAGAVSGRFTSSGGDISNGFNAQQIPRMFQKIFKQPAIIEGEETVVIGADYATLELRLAAAIFQDKRMYQQLKNGEDIHTAMAKEVTGKDIAPDGKLIDTIDGKYEYLTTEDRSKAKLTNFGFVFGMSAGAFVNYAMTSYGLKYTFEEASNLRRKYFGMYQDIALYQKRIWDTYKQAGFTVSTALGRRVKPKLGTDAINIPVQGSGAEVTKLGVIQLVKQDKDALKYIFSVVHDAIYLRVPKKDVEYWSEQLESAMLTGWEQICEYPLMHYKDIPIMADVEVIGV